MWFIGIRDSNKLGNFNTSLQTTMAPCYGHTIQNNPVLVRSRKATWIGPDQYYVG